MEKSNRKWIILKHHHQSVLLLLFLRFFSKTFSDFCWCTCSSWLDMHQVGLWSPKSTGVYHFPKCWNYFFNCSQTHSPTSSLSDPQPWCPCWLCVLHRAQCVTGAAPPTPIAGTETPSVLSCWTSLSWPLGWENWTWSTVHSILRSS